MEKNAILPGTWKAQLKNLLRSLAAEFVSGTKPAHAAGDGAGSTFAPRTKLGKRPRLAVVGIGNSFRSDDAAGTLVARALSERASPDLLIVEAGHAPENHTASLRRFAPDLILLVDAADMGKAPGAIAWISEDDIDGMSASTHSLPLSMLAKYLTLELGCQVRLLGIQPASNEVGETVSQEVLRAVEEVALGLDEAICTARDSVPAEA